jgi:diguanylate cyclase (GGDEF)-like protein/putative nucleotidyltransferase with HDIG domain
MMKKQLPNSEIELRLQQTLSHKLRDDDMSKLSFEELFQEMLIYHQELFFQNEELKYTQMRLEESLDMAESYFNDAPIGYIICDKRGIIQRINACAIELLKIDLDKWLKKDIRSLIAPESQDTFYFLWRDVNAQQSVASKELRLNIPLDQIYVKFYINRYTYEGKLFFRIAMMDVTPEYLNQQRMEKMSFHDHLTDLYNRRFLDEELNRLDHKRYYPLTIIIADVNGLKLFNDTFGHSVGDELLKTVARALRNNFRAGEIIGRISGDEFMVILPNQPLNMAETLVNRFKEDLSKRKLEELPISISTGYATKVATYQTIKSIIRLAEDRMYIEKTKTATKRYDDLLDSIIRVLYSKHYREEMHSSSVSEFAREIAIAMDLDQHSVDLVEKAALYHDIGKIAIDYGILNKVDPLTESEMDAIRTHPEMGYRMMNSLRVYDELPEIILYHHERFDGKGYPRGKAGKEIPLASRIIAVADAYDAMTSDRPYRKAYSKEKAVRELQLNSKTQFDAEIVYVFIHDVLKMY